MRVRHVVVVMLAGLPLTAQEPAGPANEGIQVYRLDKEAALGRQLAIDIRRQTTRVDSPTVQNYLEQLGQRIAPHIRDAAFPFTFSVIADDPCRTIHEPVALPGGYVFVPAALFLAAQDEAEFAGMLAHAMEHIGRRHGTRQATRGTIVNYSTVPLVFLGGLGVGCSQDHAIPLAWMASQRGFEREADSLAVQAMARAGFDPNALVRYIQRVQVRPEGTALKATSPLPDTEDRLATMRSSIEKLPAVDYGVTAGEFVAAQREIPRLVEPSPPRSKTPPTLMRKAPQP